MKSIRDGEKRNYAVLEVLDGAAGEGMEEMTFLRPAEFVGSQRELFTVEIDEKGLGLEHGDRRCGQDGERRLQVGVDCRFFNRGCEVAVRQAFGLLGRQCCQVTKMLVSPPAKPAPL